MKASIASVVMWLYIIGVIALFGFASSTTLAADYFQPPFRIAITMIGGPFLALAMWCFATARWSSPSRSPLYATRRVRHPKMLWFYAAASFVAYCIVVSMVPEFSSTSTRTVGAMASGLFFGLSGLYFVRALAVRRRREAFGESRAG